MNRKLKDRNCIYKNQKTNRVVAQQKANNLILKIENTGINYETLEMESKLIE